MALDAYVIILCIIIGLSIKYQFKILDKYDHRLLDQLFIYHTLMSIVFYLYINNVGWADSLMYWDEARTKINTRFLSLYFATGEFDPTMNMRILCYIPSNLMNLDYFTGCILFGLLGYIGIFFIYLVLKENFPLLRYFRYNKILNFSIFPLILFMPNLHFWSASPGKDVIVFFGVAAFIFSLNKIRTRIPLLIIALFFTYIIRSHITLFLVAGYGLAFLIKSRIPIYQKAIISLALFVAFIPLLNNALETAQIEDASIEGFNKFSETKAHHLAKGSGSAIDITGLPYPLQVLTFLFRPLFFDANNALALLASVENTAWLALTINFLQNKPLATFKKLNFIFMGSFFFWLIGALAFAPVFSNLGIIIRERNMFLPAFILFAVAGLSEIPKFKRFKARLLFKHRLLRQMKLEK